MAKRGWKRQFDDPIPLPRGRQLVTLQDAASYIMKLPKAEQNLPEWQTAIEALIMAAEDRGPLMHARIGVRGLNREQLGLSNPIRARDLRPPCANRIELIFRQDTGRCGFSISMEVCRVRRPHDRSMHA